MKRRTFLAAALAATHAYPLLAALRRERWDEAAEVLERATAKKQVDAAVLHVVQRQESFTRHFGGTAGFDARSFSAHDARSRVGRDGRRIAPGRSAQCA